MRGAGSDSDGSDSGSDGVDELVPWSKSGGGGGGGRTAPAVAATGDRGRGGGGGGGGGGGRGGGHSRASSSGSVAPDQGNGTPRRAGKGAVRVALSPAPESQNRLPPSPKAGGAAGARLGHQERALDEMQARLLRQKARLRDDERGMADREHKVRANK